MQARWVTFDCFGTLVDWHTGFAALLTPFGGERTPDLVRAYHEAERALERERPHRLYREILVQSLMRAAARIGLVISESQARRLPDSWGSLAVFPDVEPMLTGLRSMGCRLAVLTNCDEDLFELTQRAFRQRFDLVITAQRVGSYKPALAHFLEFARVTAVTPTDWVHVACSWFHDIVPTHELGIRSIWLDRDVTGEDPAKATIRVPSAEAACPAVQRLFGEQARA